MYRSLICGSLFKHQQSHIGDPDEEKLRLWTTNLQQKYPEGPFSFRHSGPSEWFTQDEAQFTLASISSKQTKFCYVISQLDHWYARK
jgi:hypothetical protein